VRKAGTGQARITIGQHDSSGKFGSKLHAQVARPDVIGAWNGLVSLTTRHDYAISRGVAMAAQATPTQILTRKTMRRDRMMVRRSSL